MRADQTTQKARRPGRYDRYLSPELVALGLSDREGRVMLSFSRPHVYLDRVRDGNLVWYDALGCGDLLGVGTPKVVQKLVARGLLAWSGPPEDPEQSAVLAPKEGSAPRVIEETDATRADRADRFQHIRKMVSEVANAS